MAAPAVKKTTKRKAGDNTHESKKMVKRVAGDEDAEDIVKEDKSETKQQQQSKASIEYEISRHYKFLTDVKIDRDLHDPKELRRHLGQLCKEWNDAHPNECLVVLRYNDRVGSITIRKETDDTLTLPLAFLHIARSTFHVHMNNRGESRVPNCVEYECLGCRKTIATSDQHFDHPPSVYNDITRILGRVILSTHSHDAKKCGTSAYRLLDRRIGKVGSDFCAEE